MERMEDFNWYMMVHYNALRFPRFALNLAILMTSMNEWLAHAQLGRVNGWG